MKPIALPANQLPDRFYKGGRRIAEFRRLPTWQEYTPEDWIGSTTCLFGSASEGLSRLPDGRYLRDAVEADPQAWLGPDHVQAFGSDIRLLVKLLDAGQRLPIHAHPTDAWAREHCGTAHGKAEAWYVLTPGTMHLSLTEEVPLDRLRRMVADQDTDNLLALMHQVPVQPGDTVYVPPRLLHATGEGVLLIEAQQPEDLSILLEWRGFDFDGNADGHLNLGYDLVLQAVENTPRSSVAELVCRQVTAGPALPEASLEFFRMDAIPAEGAPVAAGLAIAIFIEDAEIAGSQTLQFAAGSTVLVPYAFGDYTVRGGQVVICRPPLP
jgi:mannose-6-phosphate isomerase